MVTKPARCWECLRREISCDGQIPICGNCRHSGLVCPGYGNQRPLIWLPTGKVSRGRKSIVRRTAAPPRAVKNPKSKTTSTTALMKKDLPVAHLSSRIKTLDGDDGRILECRMSDETSKENPSKTSTSVVVPWRRGRAFANGTRWEQSLMLSPSIRTDDWNYIDALEYGNGLLFPTFHSRQIVPNPAWSGYFTTNMFQSLSPAHRQCFLAISIGYRIMFLSRIHDLEINPVTCGPAAHLWGEFYRRVNNAIGSLNEEIQENGVANFTSILLSIAQLLSTEVLICNAPMWRAHAAGALALINHCGGLSTVSKNASTRSDMVTLQSVVIAITVFHTTSPSQSLLADACNYDLDDVMALYNIGNSPILVCPAPLFRNLFIINHLRLNIAMGSMPEISDTVNICEVIQGIDDFLVTDWVESTEWASSVDSFLKMRYIMVANTIKAALALFGTMAVPCACICIGHTGCDTFKKKYREELFRLLRVALSYKVLIDHVLWPLVVAGVAAAEGTDAERSLVQDYLSIGIKDPFTGASPGSALAVMKKFWQSGKTAWDDCFEQPQAWVI